MNKYWLFFVALLGVMFWSCKEDQPEEVLPTIALTAPAADATVDLATVSNFNFTWTVEGTITGGYTLLLSQSAELTSPKTFTSSLASKEISATDLNFVLSEFGVVDGATGKIYWSVKPTSTRVNANLPQVRALNVKRLPTPPVVLTVNTGNVSELTRNSAILAGSVSASSSETNISERGFYYSTNANPQEGGTKVMATGLTTGDFSVTLSELSEGTTYYYVAFTTNEVGTTYGEAKSFTTEISIGIKASSWLFDDETDLAKAAVGKALTLVEAGGAITSVAGPTADDKAIRLPLKSHLIAEHGLVATGGEARVNDYTLLIDFKIPSIGSFKAFMQTNPANNDDADLFIRPAGQIGIGSGFGYSGTILEPNKWYRLVVSSKLGEYCKLYLNGTLLHTAEDNSKVNRDSRWSLDPAGVILFGDEDGEDDLMDVSAVSFWNRPLTEIEIAALGGF